MKKQLLALLILMAAVPAGALPFDTVFSGGRSAAMGDMRAVFSENGEAVLGNPAALAGLQGTMVQSFTRNWYGTDLRSYAVSLAHPFGRGGGLGLAWHRFGHSDLWTENLLALAGGWQRPLGPLHSPLSLGFALKALQVSAPAYEEDDYQGDFITWSADLALSLEPLSFLRIAWVEENLGAGEMKLLNGGTPYRAAPRKSRVGCGLLWRDDITLGIEYQKTETREGSLHFGLELNFYGAFLVRGGAGRDYASAGFGLDGETWQFDGAFESRGRLGTSLLFSLNYRLGKEVVRP
jgi:hypothetical protein